ncbi:hypothetical protein LL266_15525 [Vibrio anguillarum]|uniref:hypothetical protein n=1 Tax=Vibrio TaxID=662 RepID=UPI0002DB2F16|nr:MULTISPECIES: hypothetical protein [Vibrio]EJL6463815.1 hypothetical protein [Vibrio cholerae]AQM21005.1 hypothetical protein PN51_14420 [Vibrio anguillarum]AQP37755.1 hypothetical protein AA909_15460 [Vibrio anguillarum]AUB86021.1 hypothetical protein CKY00_01545 [Vibrio anguillarum]AUB89458.1 hypothetical protein CKX99_01540 [Vibrio anguillarum]
MKNKQTRMTHCQLENKSLDPYEILKSKSQRLSWNRLSDAEIYLDKKAVVSWFERLRNYSEGTVKAIIVEGILESQFHNITFILRLVQSPDFKTMTSKESYQLLYEMVCEIPQGIRDWIDEKDYLMSRDVLALLSRNR